MISKIGRDSSCVIANTVEVKRYFFAVGSEPSVWNLPQVPEVKEYIDDVNDVPDPGVTYG